MRFPSSSVCFLFIVLLVWLVICLFCVVKVFVFLVSFELWCYSILCVFICLFSAPFFSSFYYHRRISFRLSPRSIFLFRLRNVPMILLCVRYLCIVRRLICRVFRIILCVFLLVSLISRRVCLHVLRLRICMVSLMCLTISLIILPRFLYVVLIIIRIRMCFSYDLFFVGFPVVLIRVRVFLICRVRIVCVYVLFCVLLFVFLLLCVWFIVFVVRIMCLISLFQFYLYSLYSFVVFSWLVVLCVSLSPLCCPCVSSSP